MLSSKHKKVTSSLHADDSIKWTNCHLISL